MSLAGMVLTPDGFGRGYVGVEDGVIRRVEIGGPTPSDAIDLGDRIICPAFIDLHNHIVYGVYPRWQPAKKMKGRFDWRGKTRCKITVNAAPDPHYQTHVAAPHKVITNNGQNTWMLSRLATYGQIRALIGGATTAVIDADLSPDAASGFAPPGFVRDPDEWGARIWGILDPTCVPAFSAREVQSDRLVAGAAEIAAELEGGKAALLVHVGEGTDALSAHEFQAVVDRGLLTANTALIHALALTPKNWDAVRDKGATVVFSPTSNETLYGTTLNLNDVTTRNIPLALSPDWAITGSSSMLDELRYAALTFPQVSPEQWVRNCTEVPADFLRLRLGRIEAGAVADLLVISPNQLVATRADAAAEIARAMPKQLELALCAGDAIYGSPSWMGQLPTDRLATEELDVPEPGGTTFRRWIRIARDPVLPDLVRIVRTALSRQNVTLAPWWE